MKNEEWRMQNDTCLATHGIPHLEFGILHSAFFIQAVADAAAC